MSMTPGLHLCSVFYPSPSQRDMSMTPGLHLCSVFYSSPSQRGPRLLVQAPFLRFCVQKSLRNKNAENFGRRELTRDVFIQPRAFRSRSGVCGLATMTFSQPHLGEKFYGVVVGGTFDRLHQGHTLLLTTALSYVAQGGRLVVGISNGPLLAQKSLRELIQPFDTRRGAVELYLKDLAEAHGHSVEIRCFEIEEAIPKGTVEDPRLDCLVVSQETELGADSFNKHRVAFGLPPLKVVVVAIVESEGQKFSSSSFRHQSLGAFIERTGRVKGDRLPEGRLVTGPYTVGLTGGIAAGKSYVRGLLRDKGAVVLDCDVLGHLSYIPGTPTYHAMIAAFGHSIVSPVDGAINRQILSSIVFTNPNQMDVLKKIVWAAVGYLVAEKRETTAEQGLEILVVEAALLLEARWEKEMNEVWVVLAPLDVSRQRLISRNQIGEEEANNRIRSQMCSERHVTVADVVIYNGLSKDKTREQVDKAWDLLLQRMRLKSSQCDTVEDPLWFRWAGLMRRLSIKEEVALKWWPKLRSSYCETWRHYYTFVHLHALYALYHEYAHFIAEPNVFHLAIFFHKIVHHPSGLSTNANELSSATTFEKFATEAGIVVTDKEKVKALILLTQPNVSAGGTTARDWAFFLDFNLAVLASVPDDFREYKAKIRQEFRDYDDDHFQILFKKKLQRYVNPIEIFHTETFRSRYFSTAHANLLAEDSLKNLLLDVYDDYDIGPSSF